MHHNTNACLQLLRERLYHFPQYHFGLVECTCTPFCDNLSQNSCIQRKQSFWITCLLTTLYLTIAHFFKPNHNGLPIKYRLNLSFLMSCQEGKLWRMHARFGAFNSSELSVFFDCKISRSIQIIRKCECSISCVTIFLHVFFKQRVVRLTIAPAHRLQKNSRRNGVRVLTTKTLAVTFLSFKLSC